MRSSDPRDLSAGASRANCNGDLDYDRLMEIARTRATEYAAAAPFPLLVIDDLLPADVLAQVIAAPIRAGTCDTGSRHNIRRDQERGFEIVLQVTVKASSPCSPRQPSRPLVRDIDREFTALTVHVRAA